MCFSLPFVCCPLVAAAAPLEAGVVAVVSAVLGVVFSVAAAPSMAFCCDGRLLDEI